MRRTAKTTRQAGVKIFAKLSDGTKLPWTGKRAKMYETLAQLTEKQWYNGVDVSVVYQRDVTNGGTFYNLEKVKQQLPTWLEPDLVEYCTTGEW